MKKSIVKYVGLAIIIIFAIILIVAFYLGSVNNNISNVSIYAGLLVGFIVYIIGAKLELIGIGEEHRNSQLGDEITSPEERTEIIE